MLIEAGYDNAQVKNYLGNLISKKQQGLDTSNALEYKSKQKSLVKASSSLKAELAAGQGADNVSSKTEESAEMVNPSTMLKELVQADASVNSVKTNVVESFDSQATNVEESKIEISEVTYASLAEQGMSVVGIVTALKEQGLTASDILKSATELGQDMKSVAGAMQEAGFNNMEIAQAFIGKAMNWAKEVTVDVVNCAVQSLAAVLSGQGNIASTVELAYEVIVSDIMQTGKVNVEGGQIMSSMAAIQDVAKEHGVELNGVTATISGLENVQGAAIVHVDNNHWVTVTGVDADNVTVMDNGKEVVMSKAELQSRWDGNMLFDQENNKSFATDNMTILNQSQMSNIFGAYDDGDNDSCSDGTCSGDVDSAESGNDGFGGDGDGDSRGFGTIGDILGGIGEAISGAIGAVGDAIGGAIGAVGEAIGGAIGAVGNAIGGTIGGAIGAVGNVIGGAIGAVGSAISGAIGVVGDVISGAIGAVGSVISGAIGAVGNAIGMVEGLADTIVTGFANMSKASKIGFVATTLAGFALGVPSLGLFGGVIGQTTSNMAGGQSFGTALANAVDDSLIGRASRSMGFDEFGKGNSVDLDGTEVLTDKYTAPSTNDLGSVASVNTALSLGDSDGNETIKRPFVTNAVAYNNAAQGHENLNVQQNVSNNTVMDDQTNRQPVTEEVDAQEPVSLTNVLPLRPVF